VFHPKDSIGFKRLASAQRDVASTNPLVQTHMITTSAVFQQSSSSGRLGAETNFVGELGSSVLTFITQSSMHSKASIFHSVETVTSQEAKFERRRWSRLNPTRKTRSKAPRSTWGHSRLRTSVAQPDEGVWNEVEWISNSLEKFYSFHVREYLCL